MGVFYFILIYIAIGIIEISISDKSGETTKQVFMLIGKAIAWPYSLYVKYQESREIGYGE